MPRTIEYCLNKIGLSPAKLAGCAGLAEEFAAIKKAYFKTVLKCHPDKGGDPKEFRSVQRNFDCLRTLFESADPTFLFASSASKSADSYAGGADNNQAGPEMSTPSWEYYAEAAQEVVPIYRIERAKSNRSTCKTSGEVIPKDELRVGWMDSETGTYGRWVLLKCWRVPNRVWLGLPDPAACQDKLGARFDAMVPKFVAALRSMGAVLLSGLSELSPSELTRVARFCMVKENWARRVTLKDRPMVGVAGSGGVPPPSSSSSSSLVPTRAPPSGGRAPNASSAVAATAQSSSSSSALTASRRFVVPVPGRDGKPNSLYGKTVVLSGIFPEVGGGTGLSLGKNRVTAMVEAFGGRVTSSISGKTDVLLVGKEPGYAKVSQAQQRGVHLLSLEDVRVSLLKGDAFAAACALRRRSPVEIEDFSAGFRGNGLGANARLGHQGAGYMKNASAVANAVARGYAAKAKAKASPHPQQHRSTPEARAAAARAAAERGTPHTAALVPRTGGGGGHGGGGGNAAAAAAASASSSSATPKEAKPAAEKPTLEYTAAPLSTIDLCLLKPSRFLLPPAALPYRDEHGRVSLHLLRDSSAKLDAGEVFGADEKVTATLKKWLRHAEKETVGKGGHEWRYDEGEGVWVGPGDERRVVVAPLADDTDDEEGEEGEDDDSEPPSDEDDEEAEGGEEEEVVGTGGGGNGLKRKATEEASAVLDEGGSDEAAALEMKQARVEAGVLV